jgi:hypothetical protein
MDNDPYIKTADMCWQMARYLVHRAAHGSRLSQRQKKIAECEVVCVLIHFLNRILFQQDPSSSDSRMSSLATAALRLHTQGARNAVPHPPSEPITYDPSDYGANNKIVTREMYEESVYRLRENFYEERLTSATADATETFMNLLSDRMAEYNQLQQDWIPQLLTKFGKHFAAAIDPENVSLETFFVAEQEAVLMFDALGDFVPQLLAAPAT